MTKHAQRKRTRSAPPAKKATKTTAAKKVAKKTTKAPRAAAKPKEPAKAKPRDPRIPAAGTTLVRPYKGREIRVEILESGFRWEGAEYRSLSALAAAITGAKSINGFLFFRLAGPSREHSSDKGQPSES